MMVDVLDELYWSVFKNLDLCFDGECSRFHSAV